MTTTTFKVKVILEKDSAGFHAYSPSLIGLHVWGETISEAKDLARNAANAYIAALIKNGDEIPIGMEIQNKGRAIRPFHSIMISIIGIFKVKKEDYVLTTI